MRTTGGRRICPQARRPFRIPVGTAPGFILELEQGTIIALPGVPREMERLMQDTVLPYLRERLGGEQVVIKAKVLRTVGLGESWIDERIDAQMRSTNPTVGLAAHFGVVDIRITARGPSQEAVHAMIADMEREVRERIGDEAIFGGGDDRLEEVTVALLAQAGVKLAIVESATGGDVARLLRETSGGAGVVTAAHVVSGPADAGRAAAPVAGQTGDVRLGQRDGRGRGGAATDRHLRRRLGAGCAG